MSMPNRMPGRPGGGPAAARAMHEKAEIKDTKGTLSRMLKYIGAMKKLILTAFLISVVTTVISILGTRINGIAIDNFIAVHNFSGLAKLCIGILIMYIIHSIGTYLVSRIMVYSAQRTTADIRRDLFASLGKKPLNFFDSNSGGDIMSRLTNDIDNINLTLSQSVSQLLSGIINIIGMLIAMLLASPIMTLVSLITVPVMMTSTNLIVRFTRKYFRSQQKEIGELGGYVEETVSGQKAVILFGREETSERTFSEINARLKTSSAMSQALSGIMGPMMNMLNNITYLIVAAFGGYLIVTGSGITPGIVFTFLLYMKNFSRPINEIANLFNTLQSALAGAERVFEVMDIPPEHDKPEAKEIGETNGNIIADNVTFSYVSGKPVLKNASFEAKSGQTIAIVGPTGAGKTTIISLLTRFYDTDSGLITLDGIPIDEITRTSLRRSIGMVLQDTYLFSETVMDNIRYGKPTATDSEVIEAAKMANCHSFITQLENGYNTVLSDNGQDLSQGQRQLIAIARAMLLKPSILILDEATSSIDTRTEIEIQKALGVLMQGRTNFVIAHRLSTIRNADVILVIDNGEIVERGTHDELLAKNGFYADLYNSQFRSGLSI